MTEIPASCFEVWKFSRHDPKIVSEILTHFDEERGKRMVGEVDQTFAKVGKTSHLSMLSCYYVDPHVDNYHPQWVALWVLRCGPYCDFGMVDRGHKDNLRSPKIMPDDIPMVRRVSVGDIILMNGHRIHWLKQPDQTEPFVAVNFDFKDRPKQSAVEKLLDGLRIGAAS